MEYSFDVRIPEGLHARPCAKIVEILKPFEPVEIVHNNVEMKILSMLDLMLQKICYGAQVRIKASQGLPAEVIKQLENVFSND